MNKDEIFKKKIQKEGVNYNLDKTCEELSELITAIMQYKNHKEGFKFSDLVTEMVDSEISLEILNYMFRYHADEIAEEYNYKFNRMIEMLEE
jgi:hypothetical protein